jgi:hypothetical protein
LLCATIDENDGAEEQLVVVHADSERLSRRSALNSGVLESCRRQYSRRRSRASRVREQRTSLLQITPDGRLIRTLKASSSQRNR